MKLTCNQLRNVGIAGVVVIVCILAVVFLSAPPGAEKEVVIYTSVDQVYSEPVLMKFQNQTGIRVRAVYDVEAAKTTGLVNRLIAEKSNPRADVFWNGEFAQTLQLQKEGVITPYQSPESANIPSQYRDPAGYWTGLGGRARVILVNTRYVSGDQVPGSIFGLANSSIPGDRIGIANPLFGTTATHASALYAYQGPGAARAYYTGLYEKGLRMVDGNSVVLDLVESGDLYIGLTDTDDSCGALARGSPVRVIIPDQGNNESGAFIIPNTVALVAGGPNPTEGKILIDYLLSQETENDLMNNGWIQIPLRPDTTERGCLNVTGIRGMNVSMTSVAGERELSARELADIFIR